MSRLPPPRAPRSSTPVALLLGLALACLAALAGCQRGTDPAAAGGAAHLRTASALPARRPVDAVHVLAGRLLARDGPGFARLAVPPALHARLVAGWSAGTTRWPLDELPLDSRIPRMLAALQAPGAEQALMSTFRRQFAGADRDIDQAIRTLVVFGGEYVQADGGYPEAERAHVMQALTAVGDWALAAPLADPARAQPFFAALAAAARRSGIDARAGEADYAKLGMKASLERLSPFLATLVAQLRRQYALDLDASLRGLRVSLLDQSGERARLRLQYRLAGRPIDAVVPVRRIDGHWYLTDYVARAEASLAPPLPGQTMR